MKYHLFVIVRSSLAMLAALALLSGVSLSVEAQDRMGPLSVHPDNPRYFRHAATGRAVLLTGSHTWDSLLDIGKSNPPKPFDYDAYLKWLQSYGHNFFRLWSNEFTFFHYDDNDQQPFYTAPQPWRRVGPGLASDGLPQFDLTQFDPAYFDRLRSRVSAARERGLYVSVMLFEGWGIQFSPDGWRSHPFHKANNVNGLDGDADGDGRGLEVHTLALPAVTVFQDAYVRKVVDTIGEFDNVLYEVSNEAHPASTEWQYRMIRLVRDYEKARRFQHPIGMTFQYEGGNNQTLFDSPADWVSPNPDGGYKDEPPPNDGRKVIVSDTDHLWGIGGNAAWVWKSFLQGHNPIFMDPYAGEILGNRFDPAFEGVRRSMGQALALTRKFDLARMTPQGKLASSRYCLADPSRTYLVYLPEGGKVTLELTDADGAFRVEWFHPESGTTKSAEAIQGGGVRDMTSPFTAGGAIVLLERK